MEEEGKGVRREKREEEKEASSRKSRQGNSSSIAQAFADAQSTEPQGISGQGPRTYSQSPPIKQWPHDTPHLHHIPPCPAFYRNMSLHLSQG